MNQTVTEEYRKALLYPLVPVDHVPVFTNSGAIAALSTIYVPVLGLHAAEDTLAGASTQQTNKTRHSLATNAHRGP